MNSLLSALYVVGLYSAFGAGSMLIRNQSSSPSGTRKSYFPRATLLLVLAIGIPSVLQFFFPVILTALQREYERVLRGEWWRLITPLFVQDGGVGGTISNLIGLLLVGSVAEKLWGGKYMLVIFFLGGIIAEIVAFAWQPIGAGNSVGNFSLAASIAVAGLSHHPPRPVQIAAVLAIATYVILLWLQDIHGAAALVGGIQALLFRRAWQEKVSS